MDHAPAPSWLDRHLDHRPGWADAPADGLEIDPSADAAAAALDESPAPAGDSWLGDATITGLADDVDQIEITDDDLADRDDVDTEFAVPTVPDTDSEPSLVDPFDEFVAETEAPTEELPEPTVDTDEAGDVAADVDTDDIAPAPAGDTTVATASGSDDSDIDEAGPADTEGAPYDAFDSFDVADDAPGGDAVADGVGATGSSWTSEPSGDDAADTGYDAFDDLDEGTDG